MGHRYAFVYLKCFFHNNNERERERDAWPERNQMKKPILELVSTFSSVFFFQFSALNTCQ